jgi:CDP-paratose 2-epimerase
MTKICREITGNKIEIGTEINNRPADLRIYISDNSKIEKETGWKPKRNVEDVFNDTFKWIMSNEKQLKGVFNG